MKPGRTVTRSTADDAPDRASESAHIVPDQAPQSSLAERPIVRNLIAPLLVLIVASVVYGAIYFRDESVPTAVGANLVPAERMLEGEVPYRDFYKIQTPGILLINAGLFKLSGTSLLTAVSGVMVFKALTVMMIFIVSRTVTGWKAALVPALLTLVWLAPGGPFRPAPIQYEMLFIAAAIGFTLRWLKGRKASDAFAAGLAVGIVAVFKQNVGVYAAIALALSIVLNTRALPRSLKEAKRLYLDSLKTDFRSHIAAGLGIALPLAALAIYLAANGALGAAMRVFIEGPGEHLRTRFTGYPLPKHAALIFIAGAIIFLVTRRSIEKWPRFKPLFIALLVSGAGICAALVPQAAVDNTIYWFAPALFAYAIWQYARGSRNEESEFAASRHERGVLLVLLLFAMAAYGEAFPRSVRGLLIGSMPAAFMLLAFLVGRKPSIKQAGEAVAVKSPAVSGLQRGLVFSVVSLVLFIFALRVALPRYFYMDSARLMKLKADAELSFDRGRGIYLPARRAEEFNQAVQLIQSRVGEGGFIFAHALDATSYYFLADRNSPTSATLWNDAGTNDAERARIMIALREKDVRLVLTSEQAMKAERYQPLLDYLNSEFHPAKTIGRTIFLERNY